MRFPNVYFFNGTSYAGKSTLVKGLAARYDGIACEENYHDALASTLDPAEFPCLTYTRDLQDWRDFICRTPEAYAAWRDGCDRECAVLELRILEDLTQQNKKIFVDTCIPVPVLQQITDPDHVLILLSDPGIAVNRFFDRPDREKQFLYQLLLQEPDPQSAIENFRQCIAAMHTQPRYAEFLRSGFPILWRDETRTSAQTLEIAAQMLKLDI